MAQKPYDPPFSLRLSFEERARLEELADGQPLGAYIRSRLLDDLITSPAYVVIKATDRFHTQTMRVNEMWQTDFTYFKIIGWGWMYLSTVLDDFSRYIIAWRLCSTMCASDVTDTLDMALGRVDKRDSQIARVLLQGCSLGSSHGPWGLVGRGMGTDRTAVAV